MAVECRKKLFLPPKNIPNYFGLLFDNLELNCQANEAKVTGETIILLSQTMFKASRPLGRTALRSLHVFVCLTFSLHVMLQTMARLSFVAGKSHFRLSKWCLAPPRPPSLVLGISKLVALIGVHIVSRL